MANPSSRNDSTGFVAGVLSLRGLLALLVATAHTLGFTTFCNCDAPVFDQPTLREIVVKIVSAIDIPVVFFVISGLAISRSLDRKQKFGQGFRTYFFFIIRRVLRLYPAHTAATCGVIALAWLFLMDSPAIDFSGYPPLGYDFIAEWLNGAVFKPLKTRTLIGNFAIASWSMNLVVWSLYVEVCAVPFLPLLHRACGRKSWSVDLALLAGLALIAVLFWEHVAARYGFSFYLGMLVQTRGRACALGLTRITGRAGRAAALAWLAMFATCVWTAETPPNVFTQALCAFAIVCLIVWRDEDRSFRMLDGRWLQWNGRMSYSFYLWHFFLLTVAVHAIDASLPSQTVVNSRLLIFAAVEIVTVAAGLAIAQISYSCIEEPFIRWGAQLEARWRTPARPAARPAAPPRSAATEIVPQAVPQPAE